MSIGTHNNVCSLVGSTRGCFMLLFKFFVLFERGGFVYCPVLNECHTYFVILSGITCLIWWFFHGSIYYEHNSLRYLEVLYLFYTHFMHFICWSKIAYILNFFTNYDRVRAAVKLAIILDTRHFACYKTRTTTCIMQSERIMK